MSRMLRVFVNGKGVDVAEGATAMDAVRASDASAADDVARGAQLITDSRGLPVDNATTIQAGAIFRLVPKRARAQDASDDADEE
jgi:hypothetical protein